MQNNLSKPEKHMNNAAHLMFKRLTDCTVPRYNSLSLGLFFILFLALGGQAWQQEVGLHLHVAASSKQMCFYGAPFFSSFGKRQVPSAHRMVKT